MNDLFLRALLRQPVARTPVWIMRQAGRYLPEYRQLRAQAGDFLSLCKNTELACEVTLQPLRRYALDAAILFSDILTIPDAMGLGLYFEEGEGPRFKKPVRSEADIVALPVVDTRRDLSYVTDAVAMIRRELNGQVPLIGFSGSPWTLATYMVEGGSSKDYRRTKTMMYQQPELFEQLLDKLVASIIDYLNAQILNGAQAVQIFDSWGGVLAHNEYQHYSLTPMQRIVEGLIKHHEGRQVPVIVFTKGGGQWLELMAATGADCLGLDWVCSLQQARQRVGQQVALQGNLDPAVLYSSPQRIRSEVQRVLQEFGSGSGHVFNLGHGITPHVAPENVAVLVDAVHEFSQR